MLAFVAFAAVKQEFYSAFPSGERNSLIYLVIYVLGPVSSTCLLIVIHGRPYYCHEDRPAHASA
ncbi:hypothetical protein T07_12852 [Trichinella nelsoni]|uniref:Uncharacterized protein n=1 Tax=Trichinella nelsoni TaxID=6336 RepID=A0A0V0SHE9_9BILA|nr:hypothetical protein T07_12852 [Trichinella nelsoni]